MTLASILSEMAGGCLAGSRSDSVLAATWMTFPGGRGLVLVERTYRDGLCVIIDPTEADLETLRSGDLWDLWNSERAARLDGLA
jgi:hypothetical protein